MYWVTLGAVLWLIGALVPWGREQYSFTERLGQPLSLPIGVFAVSAALPIIGVALFGFGFVADLIIRIVSG